MLRRALEARTAGLVPLVGDERWSVAQWQAGVGHAEALLAESVPYATVPAALDAVREGEVDAVMVPIENSVEGGVSSTLDALNSEDSEGTLRLVGEVLVNIYGSGIWQLAVTLIIGLVIGCVAHMIHLG